MVALVYFLTFLGTFTGSKKNPKIKGAHDEENVSLLYNGFSVYYSSCLAFRVT